MKRILFLLAALILLLSVPVHADIVYEPMGDDFYLTHSSACETTYYWCSYKVISETSVEVAVSPEDFTAVTELQPGDVFSSNTTYRSGDSAWYYVRSFSGQDKDGWISSDLVERLYDSELFILDHGSEIGGNLNLDVSELDTITAAAYPGGYILESPDLALFKRNEPGTPVQFEKSYTDPEGKRWGYLGYFYGGVNGWVCLDDPNLTETKIADKLTVSEVRGSSENGQKASSDASSESPSEAPSESISPSELPVADSVHPTVLIGILCGAAVLTAAVVLILILKRKKKANK